MLSLPLRPIELAFNIHFYLFRLPDFALQVPVELESALQLKTVQYFVTKRPWLGNAHVHFYCWLVVSVLISYCLEGLLCFRSLWDQC